MKIATSILIIALSVTLLSAATPRVYAQSPLDQVGGTIKGVLDWLWENIIKPVIDGIAYICAGIVNAIRAPFDALVNVWNQWWYSLLGFGWLVRADNRRTGDRRMHNRHSVALEAAAVYTLEQEAQA